MAKQKLERNKLFLQDWQEGFSNEALGEKYKMSEGGVKALKQRLRVRNPSLYTEKRPELTKIEKEVGKASGGLIQFAGKIKKPSRKVTSTQTSASTKRMTFWLPGAIIEKIKTKAVMEGKTASQIARELFSRYL